MEEVPSDLTVVYYTANVVPIRFANRTRDYLLNATEGIPIISVSKKPMDMGEGTTNICVGPTPRSTANIYRQALLGAKAADTKYIAMAEDDILYSPDHFKHRPSPGKFAYNTAYWGLYTWTYPMLNYKGRRNLSQMICERELFIEAIEERFAKIPEDQIRMDNFGEPGKYESQLGVTVRLTEEFHSSPPNVMFSHENALAFEGLGTRKKVSAIRAVEIPYWGTAEEIAAIWLDSVS